MLETAQRSFAALPRRAAAYLRAIIQTNELRESAGERVEDRTAQVGQVVRSGDQFLAEGKAGEGGSSGEKEVVWIMLGE